jgi:hypothetical protein
MRLFRISPHYELLKEIIQVQRHYFKLHTENWIWNGISSIDLLYYIAHGLLCIER